MNRYDIALKRVISSQEELVGPSVIDRNLGTLYWAYQIEKAQNEIRERHNATCKTKDIMPNHSECFIAWIGEIRKESKQQ